MQESEDRVAVPINPEAQRTWQALVEHLKKLDDEIEGIMLQWEVGPAETRAPSPDLEEMYTYPLITRKYTRALWSEPAQKQHSVEVLNWLQFRIIVYWTTPAQM